MAHSSSSDTSEEPASQNHTSGPDFIEHSPDDLLSDFTDYDYALYVVMAGGHDYIAQITAIRDLLQRQRHADHLLEEKMKEIAEYAKRTTGMINWQATEEWGEHFYAAVYQDAAHSMAAVGMLAPLIESMFAQSFAGLRRLFESGRIAIVSSHPRWQQSPKKWNCHLFLDGQTWRKGVVKGILELTSAVGLSTHMPNDLEPVLQALFDYRNTMFHNGFEWPPAERARFAKRKDDWPSEWFSLASSGDEPWIFYLTESFITHCLDVIDSVLSGVGAFARAQIS